MDNKDLKNKLDKLDTKLDKLDGRIASIDTTLVKQQEQLEHHIYRTTLAEENISLLRKELKPIESHVNAVGGALKLVGLVGVVVGILTGVAKLFLLIQ